MTSTLKVTSRMEQQINALAKDFAGCLEFFDRSDLFVGPSRYFHHKVLERRASHDSIGSLLGDDLFFEFLYATLTAWGLHRMGPGNTKLRRIDEIKSSFRQQAANLEVLAPLTITSLAPEKAGAVITKIWSVLSALRISIAEAQIVANSKALHHVLPRLVPPIDREYTFKFFYGRGNLSVPEQDAFLEMYMAMNRLAFANQKTITSLIGKGWHTNEAKVIDNAIVGFMLKQRRSKAAIAG